MKITWCVVTWLVCLAASIPFLHAFMVPLPQRHDYPPAVSFIIIDLKYDTDRLKICEFGEGYLSGFVGHEKLYGSGKIWAAWWSFLAKLRKPILFIAPAAKSNSFEALRKQYKKNNKDALSMHALFACNGICAPTLQDAMNMLPVPQQKISEINAVAVQLNQASMLKQYDALTIGKEGLVVADYVTQSFALNKLFMHALFVNDPVVAKYRPACCLINKEAVARTEEDIKRIIPADAYVIKPINAWKGRGIVITTADNLGSTSLRLFGGASSDEASKFWRNRQEVLIESLEHSIPVAVEDKLYDATMRVAVGLVYEKGQVTMKIFGAYWKLPEAALDAQASLQKVFLSHIIKGGTISSAVVDAQTFAAVEKDLKIFMPHVFKKMVALKYNKIPLIKLKSIIDGTADEDLLARLALL